MTVKKKPAPKKRAQKQKRNLRISAEYLLLFFVAVILVSIGYIGYFYGYTVGKKEQYALLQAERMTNAELSKALEAAREKTARHEYEQVPPKPPKEPVHSKPYSEKGKKPMLAIIIDDVAFPADVRRIERTGLPLTMSFMPPTPRHPTSAKLAAKQPYYMVHFPLEAMHFSSEEAHTLHVGDSEQVIDARVAEIQKLFPKARFVNNHTGSKFTADQTSMEYLIHALNARGIRFIDSRTTAQTAVPDIMKRLGRPYYYRDTFLDNTADADAVKKQVEKAVMRAKKYGFAIAIGHPHSETMAGIVAAKAALAEVQVVPIGTLVRNLEK